MEIRLCILMTRIIPDKFMVTSIEKLFSERYLEAYNEGLASFLVKNRNRNIGTMFAAERGVYYVHILFRMLCFRREHELEPLNDEIYFSVKSAQESVCEDEYNVDTFNHDMQQLLDWKLIERRIEKERLRGYKDARRQKFRFRLNEETVSFLVWLEDRLNSDIEDKTEDARNLLLDLAGRLKEISRDLNRVSVQNINENDELTLRTARTVVYNTSCLSNLTFKISKQLNDLNANLLFFLVKNYNIEEAKKAIDILDFYSGAYLSQVYKLRTEILDDLEQITLSSESKIKIKKCHEIMESEFVGLPSMAKVSRYDKKPTLVFKNILEFYSSKGKLDTLCERINQSAMKVWGKLSAHLRELERSNTRLEDLDSRLHELAELDENDVPKKFLMDLLSPAYMKYDPNYWDDHEDADPPVLKRYSKHHTRIPGKYIPKKTVSDKNKDFVSVEQAKLNELENWIKTNLPGIVNEVSISDGKYESIEDLKKIVELIKAGYLGNGKKLCNINLKLKFDKQKSEQIAVRNMALECKSIKLHKSVEKEF